MVYFNLECTGFWEGTLAKVYGTYDQLNRLISADVYTNSTLSSNSWNSSGSADSRWAEHFSYDANGNITSLTRNGNKADTLAMDDLDYYYTTNTNRLAYVEDAVADINYSNDIDNQSSGNYEYDAIGNLIKDVKEEIYDINWTVYGKISSIIRTSESDKSDLSFSYTPDGHRSIKSVTQDSSFGTSRSVYIHDAQGNIMAVYALPIVKVLDTTQLDFEIINNELLNHITLEEFGDFIIDDMDMVSLLSAQGYYDPTGNYRTAIYTASSALEEALLLILDPAPYFSANSGLIQTVFTNNYTNLEVLQVLLEGNSLSSILSSVITNEISNSAFHSHLMATHGNTWLSALYTQDNGAFQTFYINAMGMYGPPGLSGQTYSFMENELTNVLTPVQLHAAMAALLSDSYVYNAYDNNFTTVDKNQLLSNYTGFKSAVYTIYSESDLVSWAASYDLEELWTETLNEETLSDILDWYEANQSDAFLKKCIIIYSDYVNTMLTNAAVNLYDYMSDIKSYLGQTVFDNLCGALEETYFIPATELSISEWHMYGSSRLGIYQADKKLAIYYESTLTTMEYQSRVNFRVVGKRRFELSNHLGNVLATVSDKRIAYCSEEQTTITYHAEVITATDYHSYGSIMEGRQWSSGTYRFGFNGKENDVESGTQDYGMRIYDPRLCRFLSVDPISLEYPWNSPYHFAGNTPICASDLDGLEPNIETIGLGALAAGFKVYTQRQVLRSSKKFQSLSDEEKDKVISVLRNSAQGVLLNLSDEGVSTLGFGMINWSSIKKGQIAISITLGITTGLIQGHFSAKAFSRKYDVIVNDNNYKKNEALIKEYYSLLDEKRFAESALKESEEKQQNYSADSEEGREVQKQKAKAETDLAKVDSNLNEKKSEFEKASKENSKALLGTVKIFKSIKSIKKKLAK